MIYAIPNAPPALIVEAASNHQPYALLGFVATGSPTALTCAERLASRYSLSSGRTEGPNNRPEVMITFERGLRQSQLLAYKAGRSGECRGARIEVVVVPLDALKSGGGGLEKASIEEPTFIVEPEH